MDVKRLIGEVAKRHGVLLAEDDAIFAAVTLNELLLADHVQRVQAAVEAAQQTSAVACAQQVDAAKKAAGLLVTGAADYVVSQIRAAAQAAGDAAKQRVEESLRKERRAMEEVAARIEKARGGARWAAVVAVAAACLAVGLSVGLLLAR